MIVDGGLVPWQPAQQQDLPGIIEEEPAPHVALRIEGQVGSQRAPVEAGGGQGLQQTALVFFRRAAGVPFGQRPTEGCGTKGRGVHGHEGRLQ